MSKGKGEIKGWITKNGVHIPIYGEYTVTKNEPKAKSSKVRKSSAEKIAERKVWRSKEDNHISKRAFESEVQRQHSDLTVEELDEYVTSSYGGIGLGDKVSKFVDNAPETMKYGEGSVYRGLAFGTKEERDNFINNDIIKSRRDGLSWTDDESVAKAFSSEVNDFPVILVNEDDSKNAIGIQKIADTPMMSSHELLFSSSTDFEVIDTEEKDGIVYVYTTQVPFLQKKYDDRKGR